MGFSFFMVYNYGSDIHNQIMMCETAKTKKSIRAKTKYLVKKGSLKIADICCFCGLSGATDYHHPEYSTPYNAKRCHKVCHTVYHNKRNAELRRKRKKNQ